jgi:hypothetical protein
MANEKSFDEKAAREAAERDDWALECRDCGGLMPDVNARVRGARWQFNQHHKSLEIAIEALNEILGDKEYSIHREPHKLIADEALKQIENGKGRKDGAKSFTREEFEACAKSYSFMMSEYDNADSLLNKLFGQSTTQKDEAVMITEDQLDELIDKHTGRHGGYYDYLDKSALLSELFGQSAGG